MKKLLIYILLFVITAAVSAVSDDGGTRSPFAFGAGARDLSLGGANLAVSDDATAPFWNASHLARVERYTVTGFHSRLYDSDVAYQYFGAVIPTLDWGCIGLGIFRLGISGIEQRDADNVLIPGEIEDNQLAIYLGYAKNISGYDIGMAITFEHQSIGDYSATSSPGLNISAGRTFTLGNGSFREMSIVLSGRNLIKRGMELVNERAEQPSTFEAGLSLTMAPAGRRDHKMILSTAFRKVDYIDSRFAAGLEYSFYDMISLRGGTRDGKLSAGGGLSYKSITFDYALVDRDLGSLHMFAVSTSFGSPVSARKKLRADKREAEFNSLMNDRLTSSNRSMITELVGQGKDFLENGDLVEAENHLDRALFLARNAGVDTSGIYELAQAAGKRLNEVTNRQVYGQFMDSAQTGFDNRDYLTAKYFAGLALEKFPNSNDARSLLERAGNAIEMNASREDMIVKQLISIDSLLSYGRIDQALSMAGTMAGYAPDDERIKLALKKARFEHYKETASNAFASGDLETATAAVDTALILYPEHQWCLNIKDQIRIERKRLASVNIPTRTEKKPAVLSAEILREVQSSYETGRRLFEKGDLAEAISRWEDVEHLAPGYQSVRQYLVKAYKFVGVELYGQNRFSEAIDIWKKAARLAPDNEEIFDYIKRTENEIKKLEELSYETE